MNFNLKKVIENKGNSIFPKELLETIFDTNKYFAQNKNNTIASLIPNVFLEGYDNLAKIKITSPKNFSNVSSSIKSEKLLFQAPFLDRISIYKTLVRESFARNKSVFLVLPTESDINKFKDQISKGIEQFTFPLHSGISAKKNLITCEKVLASSHPVLLIGTPPFLSIPEGNLGTIILEHESSSAYKTVGGPHLDLRVFAEIYASKINAKFILADEMLRYETIGRKDTDNLVPLHPVSFSIDFIGDLEIFGKNEKFKILKEEISKPEYKSGFILDGFPRNISQVLALDKITKIDKVIEISISDEEAISRIVNRISCKSCGFIFNIKTNPSKLQNTCDNCNSKLEKRSDDNEEAIKKRLAIYKKDTSPILLHYKAITINGQQEIDKVTQDILNIL